jgi:hypothetical protein
MRWIVLGLSKDAATEDFIKIPSLELIKSGTFPLKPISTHRYTVNFRRERQCEFCLQYCRKYAFPKTALVSIKGTKLKNTIILYISATAKTSM